MSGLALGDAPNKAARIQGVAQPDTVVISSATYRLIEGYFACQPLGATALKGLSQPMELHRVLRESGAQSRFEVAVTIGLTPLVGREREADFLLRQWEKVKQGEGQVVLLSAEAGIGKSRMVQVLKERALGPASTTFECRCSGYYQHSALRPLIGLLERMLQVSREDSSQEKLRKLENQLKQVLRLNRAHQQLVDVDEARQAQSGLLDLFVHIGLIYHHITWIYQMDIECPDGVKPHGASGVARTRISGCNSSTWESLTRT